MLNQLVDLGLICEDYGGDTQVVEVSGRSGEGLDSLVESLLLQVHTDSRVTTSYYISRLTLL